MKVGGARLPDLLSSSALGDRVASQRRPLLPTRAGHYRPPCQRRQGGSAKTSSGASSAAPCGRSTLRQPADGRPEGRGWRWLQQRRGVPQRDRCPTSVVGLDAPRRLRVSGRQRHGFAGIGPTRSPHPSCRDGRRRLQPPQQLDSIGASHHLTYAFRHLATQFRHTWRHGCAVSPFSRQRLLLP